MEDEISESNLNTQNTVKVDKQQIDGTTEKIAPTLESQLHSNERLFTDNEKNAFWQKPGRLESAQKSLDTIDNNLGILMNRPIESYPITIKPNDIGLIIDKDLTPSRTIGYCMADVNNLPVIATPEPQEGNSAGDYLKPEMISYIIAHERTHSWQSNEFSQLVDEYSRMGIPYAFNVFREAITELTSVNLLSKNNPDLKADNSPMQYKKVIETINGACKYISETLPNEYPTPNDALMVFQRLIYQGEEGISDAITIFERVYGELHNTDVPVIMKIAQLSSVSSPTDADYEADPVIQSKINNLRNFLEGTRSKTGY